MVTEVSPFAVDMEWGEINDPRQIEAVVKNLGQAVAIMHSAADNESEESLVPFSTEKAIDEVIGDDRENFEGFLVDFAHSYSDRARNDHQLFIDAFRNGKIAGTV
jgi:hypothetical protein